MVWWHGGVRDCLGGVSSYVWIMEDMCEGGVLSE